MKKISLLPFLILLSIIVVSQNNKDVVFFDDFEAYNPGEQLACQNPDDWTTWDETPCSDEDPYITNAQAYSGSNSVLIEGSNNLVLDLPNYTAGVYIISFQMLIPEGFEGYFSTLQNFESENNEWGMYVKFENYGYGYVYAGSYNSIYFDFSFNTWFLNEVYIDLNNDMAIYFINGNPIKSWVWSTGVYGENDLNQIGGSHFFAYSTHKYYLDDYNLFFAPSLNPPSNLISYEDNNDVILTWDAPDNDGKYLQPDRSSVAKDLTGYNVYRDNEVIGFTTEITHTDLNPGAGIYEYCIKAVYSEGESLCSNTTAIFLGELLFPPNNLIGPEAVGLGDDINLNWDIPDGGEWIHWDTGENIGNSIGLTNGGTFYIASHWMPVDIAVYNEFSISKMSFFAGDDPQAEYTLKVWTGSDPVTEIYSQEIDFFIANSWNEIDITNPFLISNTEYWFGYAVTHNEGTLPAGADDGPAIQYKGDMISLDGTNWESMSASYNMDYNWNFQVYVAPSGKTEAAIPISKPSRQKTNTGTFVSSLNKGTASGVKNIFTPKTNNDLLSYNIYRDALLIGNTTDIEFTDVATEISNYLYCVTAVYEEGESVCSNELVVFLITGAHETLSTNIQIFPNPASNIVNIKSDLKINNVKVYNFSGQIIRNEKVDSKFYQINTSQLKAGIYFFRIETEEGVVSERVVVQ